MNYETYVKTKGNFRELDFLNRGAHQYLQNCEAEVFEVWKQRRATTNNRSLAETLGQTVKPRFDKKLIGVSEEFAEDVLVFWLFQNENYNERSFMDIVEASLNRRLSDILVVTQTGEFRTKFHYDPSATTIESVIETFDRFTDLFQLKMDLRFFCLVLTDFRFMAFPPNKKQGQLRLIFNNEEV